MTPDLQASENLIESEAKKPRWRWISDEDRLWRMRVAKSHYELTGKPWISMPYDDPADWD